MLYYSQETARGYHVSRQVSRNSSLQGMRLKKRLRNINNDMKNKIPCPPFVQQDLFASPYIKYNRAIRLLTKLKPLEAEKTLAEFERIQRPGRKLSLEYNIIAFLKDTISLLHGKENARLALKQWDDRIEQQWRTDCNHKEFLSHLRKSYFRRISLELLPDGGPKPAREKIFLDGTALLIMIRGGFWQEVALLAPKIADLSDSPGRIYGYLGDALFCMQQNAAARHAYMAALFLDAEDVDAINLIDSKVKELLSDPGTFAAEEDIPAGEWTDDRQWAAALGMLVGVFELEAEADTVKAAGWMDVLRSKDTHPGHAFAAGMLRSSMGMKRLEIMGTDISSVRRRMKEISPELFEVFMRG